MEAITRPNSTLSHHTARGFVNPFKQPHHRLGELFRWKFGRGPAEPPAIDPAEVPPYVPEVVEPDWERLHHPDPAVAQATWIGHSTFLLQVGGKNILTDPVFGPFCSPFPIRSLRRQSPVGVPFDRMPPIDAVVLSHNHYDHLEAATIGRLGNRPVYFVPLGLKAWLARRGINRVEEMDWWESRMWETMKIQAVPAQHFSARTPWDRNRTLWCGWVLSTAAGNLYFAGDSGYGPHFAEIGERAGPMVLSCLPIGAYRPRWFMAPVHMDAAEAVQVHKDVRSQLSVGMHWGTFALTDEPLAEPPLLLRRELARAGVPSGEFQVSAFGQTLAPPTQTGG